MPRRCCRPKPSRAFSSRRPDPSARPGRCSFRGFARTCLEIGLWSRRSADEGVGATSRADAAVGTASRADALVGLTSQIPRNFGYVFRRVHPVSLGEFGNSVGGRAGLTLFDPPDGPFVEALDVRLVQLRSDVCWRGGFGASLITRWASVCWRPRRSSSNALRSPLNAEM